MAHRDPMLAVRSKLEARERDLADTEAELAEAQQELARHKVRIDELVVAQHRVAGPAVAADGVAEAAVVRPRSALAALALVGGPIRSEPLGAEVWVDGTLVGVTPYVVERNAGDPDQRIELRAPGYPPLRIDIGGAEAQRIEARLMPER